MYKTFLNKPDVYHFRISYTDTETNVKVITSPVVEVIKADNNESIVKTQSGSIYTLTEPINDKQLYYLRIRFPKEN